MVCWLVGVGPMAQDYARALVELKQSWVAIGRGEASAAAFEKAVGQAVVRGGLKNHLVQGVSPPHSAIVAVGVEALAETTRTLLKAGVRRILVEKPAGLNHAQVQQLASCAAAESAEVVVAYNRRCYASTHAARAMIEEDGGLRSFSFELTEWAHRIGPLEKGPGVKAHWFLANSTHVADLAFHLGGFPSELQGFVSGALDWHPAASIFVGAGITERGVPFSYQADWAAPGRWGVEMMTARRRLILRPMEQLQVTPLGSVAIEPVTIDDAEDRAFKPGLLDQTRRFFDGDDSLACTISQQAQHSRLYELMAGYGIGADEDSTSLSKGKVRVTRR